MKSDRLAGLVITFLGTAGLIATAQVDVIGAGTALTARFFPYLLTGGLVLCGIALAVRPGETPLADVLERLTDSRGLAFAVLFCVYAFSFRIVDFRLGTFVFVLGAMMVMGERRPLALLITPALISGGAYLLFRHAFTVVLPTWN